MFILLECILFLCIIIYDYAFIKYISIVLCLLYSLYYRKEYRIYFIILIADYILLWGNDYYLGIVFFMFVQCFYHYIIHGHSIFYLFMLTSFFPSYYILGFFYMIMTLINLIIAYQNKHWLFITLVLLASCDLCVAIQYILSLSVPFIWILYLPSQVYYTLKAPSIKIEPLQWKSYK